MKFKTEDYEDDRISSLGRRQEKMLRDEARQLQLVFSIDRVLNIIELKGSKESIAKMKTKIVKVLGQVEKESVRKEEVQKGIWRLLCGPMKQRWMKIEGQCQDSEVILTQPSEDERKLTIALKGDRVEVQKLIQDIHQLVKSVEISVVPLTRPEVRKYFSEGEDGKMKIPHIEKSTRVCIEVCAVGEDMDIEIPGIMNEKEEEEEDEAMKVAEDNGIETELRIYGETEENVKAAMDTLNKLINMQFKTEYYDDDRISSLGRRQEKMLRDEARQLQLVFIIDRSLNEIELKGKKDSIAEMMVKIVKVLGQVEKGDSW